MKILVSSKLLASKLNEIDFDKDSMQAIRGGQGCVIFVSCNKNVEMGCSILDFHARIVQENTRWDHIKKLVNNVSEQPIILNIRRNAVNVTFQY